jgi:hypothetical protein
MSGMSLQGQAEVHRGGPHDEQAPVPQPAEAPVVRLRHA